MRDSTPSFIVLEIIHAARFSLQNRLMCWHIILHMRPSGSFAMDELEAMEDAEWDDADDFDMLGSD